MIDKLIDEGKGLETTKSESMGIKYFNTVQFETWVSKSVLYLETYQINSVVTEKAKERYKKLSQNNNYDYYKFLLGALEAVKAQEEEQADMF